MENVNMTAAVVVSWLYVGRRVMYVVRQQRMIHTAAIVDSGITGTVFFLLVISSQLLATLVLLDNKLHTTVQLIYDWTSSENSQLLHRVVIELG